MAHLQQSTLQLCLILHFLLAQSQDQPEVRTQGFLSSFLGMGTTMHIHVALQTLKKTSKFFKGPMDIQFSSLSF